MKHALALLLAAATVTVFAADPPKPTFTPGPGDEGLKRYFERETDAIAKACLADIHSAADWDAKKGEYRRQLAEMLGLWPMPEKTDLDVHITGKLDHQDFTVEKLYFQSRPGLYVTGNLYVPTGLTGPAPTILYVCGHGNVKKNGISYGSKVAMQHWPGWFARNGYVCLIIDTLQLGEIEGIHHGTYREKMWWWHDRGYTPAGVEAWNDIRALDYLETRPEVDKTRLGVTGRSGGGAYSWWLTALDDRIKVAVPTAGITDLHNHVVDGTVEGHCDCMFMVNTYRWDFPLVAALAAPRPLLIANTDKDTIFPLDGVYRVHQGAHFIYNLSQSADRNLGLIITEGPHKDTQDLQVPTFHWFNRHFKKDESPIEMLAKPLFEPEQLKVFAELPKDQINTKIQETFVPQAPPPKVPETKQEWTTMRDGWMTALKAKTFHGWPAEAGGLDLKPGPTRSIDGLTIASYEFTSQHDVPLTLYVAKGQNLADPELLVLNVLDQQAWESSPVRDGLAGNDELRKMLQANKWIMAYVAPRGVGPTAYTADERKFTQILRRFPLLGQTLEGMQVYDVRRAIQAVRAIPQLARTPLWLQADRRMAGVALYASLFEPDVARLDLHDLPRSHVDGPHLLNVLKTLDLPAALAMAAERSRIVLDQKTPGGWDYPRAVAAKLSWGDQRIQIRQP
ncbi:MAG TPA: prolyl oligopeptidase family serine peptidase [Tepidisphaeraceae bacterium]|jgi:dienelactone hydrolase